MEIKFLNQPKDIKFIDILSSKLRDKSYSKVWIIAGFAKDNALDCIIDDIKVARENGTEIECIFGLDKKNTSKEMLLKYILLGCKIRYHLNEGDIKLESRLYAFENPNGNSYVYITGSKFSEGGISSNLTIIEEIKYSKEENLEFGKVKAAIENGIVDDEFENLTEDKLKELAQTGDIVARITERKIPSISELYKGNDSISVDSASLSQEYNDEKSNTDFSELLNKDLDFDIEVDNENIKVQTSLGEEVEHKIKKQTPKKEEQKVVSKLVIGNEKENDFAQMSALILPLSKSNIGKGEIRIPSAITANMLDFLDYPDDFHTDEDEAGSIKEFKKIGLNLFENQTGLTKSLEDAYIIQTVKYTAINHEELLEVDLKEGDLIRFIKLGIHEYQLEIIKKDTQEYEIWSGFCTQTVKGSSKKFGTI